VRHKQLLDRTEKDYDRMIGRQVALALATCLHQVGLVDRDYMWTGLDLSEFLDRVARVGAAT
jgi:hypothetical protein